MVGRSLTHSLIALVVAAACSVLPADIGQQVLPGRTDYRTLEAAFHILIERHVDRPSSQQLLTGAINGAEEYVRRPVPKATPSPAEGAAAPSPTVQQLPPAALPTPTPASVTTGGGCNTLRIARPELTGSPESDLVKVSDAFDKALAACPTAKKHDLDRAATNGMAKSMNECHTYYLEPDRAKSFNRPPEEYSGIGATIAGARVEDLAEISSVFPESPAEKAGVKPGDRIKSVDGVDVKGKNPGEIADLIKGPEATNVRIVLVRDGRDITFNIIRKRLTPPRAYERAYDNGVIGSVTIFQLNGDVAKQTADAVGRLTVAGARAFVIDLRNDPGGDLTAAVDIASIFVKDAVLVKQVGRDGQVKELKTNDRFHPSGGFNKPLVVLVNERSASGSEIIAAGVRANGAGTVIGTQTAGCVGIGQPREMPDGGLLLVTLARMQDAKTGAELNGEGRGVVPDRAVKDDAATPEDDQLELALSVLRQQVSARP